MALYDRRISRSPYLFFLLLAFNRCYVILSPLFNNTKNSQILDVQIPYFFVQRKEMILLTIYFTALID